jgi:hypothetical protein
MADKTMPPNDPMMGAPAMPGEMGAPAPMGEMAPPQGGDVMISMPKSAFDALQQIVQALSQGLDELSQTVNGQAKEGAAEGEMEAEAPEAENETEIEIESKDKEFLKGMMEEGNMKTR